MEYFVMTGRRTICKSLLIFICKYSKSLRRSTFAEQEIKRLRNFTARRIFNDQVAIELFKEYFKDKFPQISNCVINICECRNWCNKIKWNYFEMDDENLVAICLRACSSDIEKIDMLLDIREMSTENFKAELAMKLNRMDKDYFARIENFKEFQLFMRDLKMSPRTMKPYLGKIYNSGNYLISIYD